MGEVEKVARQIRSTIGCWPECQEDDGKPPCFCHTIAAQKVMSAVSILLSEAGFHNAGRYLESIAREERP